MVLLKIVTSGQDCSDSVIMDADKLNFTFAGCGFLGIYHVGVASCLREYAPAHTINQKIAGASAGAMVAALLLCEAPLGFCTSWTLKLAAKARQRSLGPMHPSFNITEHLRSGLDEILPVNAHEICNNKLHISMTRVRDGENVIISEFGSRSELIQALLCSGFIPLWSGLIPPLFRGERYVDGALSDNLPIIDSFTVTVSPFAGRHDICPKNESQNIHHIYLANTSIQLSYRNLYRVSRIMFPPHPEKLGELCKKGFEDALAFLKSHCLVNCSRHLAICSVLSRSTNDADTSDSDGAAASGDAATDGDANDDDADDDGDDDTVNLVTSSFEDDEDYTVCKHCAANQDDNQDLHPSVITALEEAIDAVNSSYILWVKNWRSYRTFSVICSPLYLPFDLTVVTLLRILKWLPSLHKDVKWLMETAMFYTKLFSGKVITKGKHTYTAKFVCQLAITEIQQTDVTSDMVMTSQAHVRDQRVGFGLGLSTSDNMEFVQNLREQYLESKTFDSLEVDTILPSGEHKHESFSMSGYSGNRRPSCCPSSCPSRNVTPQISRKSSLTEVTSPPSGDDEHEHGAAAPCNQYMDTFERCVQVADHTEAVLAYYYKDEEGKLKTTEIFKLEEAENAAPPSAAELVSALAAKKLKSHGSTRSVISATNMEEDGEVTEADRV